MSSIAAVVVQRDSCIALEICTDTHMIRDGLEQAHV
jgi:hypothetical protein